MSVTFLVERGMSFFWLTVRGYRHHGEKIWLQDMMLQDPILGQRANTDWRCGWKQGGVATFKGHFPAPHSLSTPSQMSATGWDQSVQTREPVGTFHFRTLKWEGPRDATFLGMPSRGCMHISILSENGQVVAIQGPSNPEVSQHCGQ